MKQTIGAMLTVVVVVVAKGPLVQASEDERQPAAAQNTKTIVIAKNDVTVSTDEFYKILKKPTTPLELLENMKLAIEHNLLLREDFYSDENLKKFFGGSRVVWSADRRTAKYGDVREFGDLFENSRRYPGLDAGFYRRLLDGSGNENEAGKIHAHLVVSTGHDSRLTAETVEGMFGTASDISNPHRHDNPAHPTPLQPKTHKLGNTRLAYNFEHASAKTSAWFITNGDGTVDRFGLVQEER